MVDRGVARNLLRGTKDGVWGTEGIWGEAPRSRRQMLNIRLNIAIDRHKSRPVQRPIIDYTLKKFPATTGGHAPMPPLATLLMVEWDNFRHPLSAHTAHHVDSGMSSRCYRHKKWFFSHSAAATSSSRCVVGDLGATAERRRAGARTSPLGDSPSRPTSETETSRRWAGARREGRSEREQQRRRLARQRRWHETIHCGWQKTTMTVGILITWTTTRLGKSIRHRATRPWL